MTRVRNSRIDRNARRNAGSSRHVRFTLSALVAGAALLGGCSSESSNSGAGGKATGAGGTKGGGGTVGGGGSGVGGSVGIGGAGGPPAGGGATGLAGAAGGAPGLGGSVAVGGAAAGVSGAGGVSATGGAGGVAAAAGAGGVRAAGGVAAVGGSVGSGGASTGAGGAGGVGATSAAATLVVVPISAVGPDRFYGVTYDAAGNIFATGQVATSNDAAADIALVVAKFTPTGALDPTFGTAGLVTRNIAVGTNGELFRGIVVQSTGKIVVSGTVEHVGAADARDRDIALARFNANGTKDTTFGTDGIAIFDLSNGAVNGTGFVADSAWGLARYPDDRLVVSGGEVRGNTTDTDFVILRLTADGQRDIAFGTNGLFALDLSPVGGTGSNPASPRDVTILPGTEGIVGAGYQPLSGHNTSPVVYKITDTGVLDVSFGVGGAFTTPVLAEQTECYAAVVQPDATGSGYKLVTTGYGKSLASETTDIVSLRLNKSGTLDTTYGTNGVVRIDIGGFADNSRKVLVHPDRRVLLAGGGRQTSANVDGIVVVLTPDGQPSTPYAATGWKPYELGGPSDFLWSLALSPDGKTAAAVGILGVGTAPTPPTLNDDAALLLLPL